jgi:hypothetical protein
MRRKGLEMRFIGWLLALMLAPTWARSSDEE